MNGDHGDGAMARVPGPRASDEDRKQVIERLQAATGDGVIDLDELGQRIERVYAAKTLPELARITADLPPPAPTPRAPEDELTAMDSASFRGHLTVYLLTIAFLIGIWLLGGAGHFWPFYPAAGWGIAIGAHYQGAATVARKLNRGDDVPDWQLWDWDGRNGPEPDRREQRHDRHDAKRRERHERRDRRDERRGRAERGPGARALEERASSLGSQMSDLAKGLAAEQLARAEELVERKTRDVRGAKPSPPPAPAQPPVPPAPAMPEPATSGPVAPAATPDDGPAPSGPSRRFVAAMFVDIAGSTSLNEALGDEGYSTVRDRFRSLVEDCARAESGMEANIMGDGVLVRFDHPADAARAAVQIMRRLSAQRVDTGFAPSVRIGIHSGDAMDDDGDIIGQTVNLASRVTAAAGIDEVWCTEHVADHVAANMVTSDQGLHSLKGINRPRHLLAIEWR